MAKREELGSEAFWRLMHACFRHSNDDSELKRVDGVLGWVSDNLTLLDNSLQPLESKFLRPIMHTYDESQTSLTVETFKDLISDIAGPSYKALQEMLEEYEERGDTTPRAVADLPPLLRAIIREDLQNKLEAAAIQMHRYLVEDLDLPGDKKKLQLSRPEKAYTYLRDALIQMAPLLCGIQGQEQHDFSVVEDVNVVKEDYIQYSREEAHKRTIPIGLPKLDRVLQAKMGHFWGILGSQGHRKTSLARTWVYNAALAGRRVAHYALEMGVKDEFPSYLLLHCRNKYAIPGFNIRAYQDGQLPPQAQALLCNMDKAQLRKDLEGDILYRHRPNIGPQELMRDIEDTVKDKGLDMVLVDYLTILDMGGGRGDNREAINRMLQQFKPFAESLGILLVSPIQGNREGLKRCESLSGQWDSEGIDTYTGYNKACDVIIGVYSAEDNVTISSVKTRFSGKPEPMTFRACPDTQFIYEG